jgi:hypothetical protein
VILSLGAEFPSLWEPAVDEREEEAEEEENGGEGGEENDAV